MTRFSQLIQGARRDGGRWCYPLPDDWMQGRSAFGGLQVSFALHAMRALVPDVPLRTVQTTFIAPMPVGDVWAEAKILRTGKNATHVECRLGGDELQALVIAVFGAPRTSVVHLMPARTPLPTTSPLRFPFLPGVTPNFTQHLEVDLLQGTLPFSGTTDPEQRLQIRLLDEGNAQELHVPLYGDFIPPIGLSYLDAPAPGSTLTWMLELLRERWENLPLAGWGVDGRLESALSGYTSQFVTLWAPDGTPAAFSRQSMLIFG